RSLEARAGAYLAPQHVRPPPEPHPCPVYGTPTARAYDQSGAMREETRPERRCGFRYADGVAMGQHVKFHLDERTGDVTRYTVEGTSVFYGMSVRGGNPILDVQNHGWLFARGRVAAYGFHDGPGGGIAVAACGAQEAGVVFKLADGVFAKQGDGEVYLGGAFHGVFTGKGAVRLSVSDNGREVLAKIAASNVRCEPNGGQEPHHALLFHGRPAQFRDEPEPLVSAKARAIAERRLGAEAEITADAQLRTVDYTGVEVRLREAVSGRAILTVDSPQHEGKIVTFRLPRAILSVMAPEEVSVLFDGGDARMAASFEDLQRGGPESKFVVVIAANHVEVLVWVPHFSVHEITIQSVASASIVGSPAWIGVAVGGAAIAAAACLTLRGRRDL
ncbi:MAG TPA: hypothetical protein VM681_10735, partial [Candidatus Thermoplasmatota archaeon]|nr:hypothetical protein [Candidatus Thermoplasmatota archaeon]